MERWPSGRRRTIGNRVYREVPRVRIPLSPRQDCGKPRVGAGPPRAARPAIVALSLVALGCAPVLPGPSTQRSLVRDVERVVDVRGDVGWFIDESEIQAVLPDVMKSFCQVPLEEREAAVLWLDHRIVDLGGPDVDAAWRTHGKKLSKIEPLLLATRTRMLLARATEWAKQGRCPFWLEPTPRFAGVHTQDHRFIATVE